MSFMKGDLLRKTQRLIQGGVISPPRWFDAVRRTPPQPIRSHLKKPPKIVFPEDRLIQGYFSRHPEANCIPFELNSFDPPIARKFAWRVLELLERGYDEDWARDIVEADLVAEEKAMRRKLVQEGKPLPKSAIEAAQEEEWGYIAHGLHNLKPVGSEKVWI